MLFYVSDLRGFTVSETADTVFILSNRGHVQKWDVGGDVGIVKCT